jgi:HNH endonuclease
MVREFGLIPTSLWWDEAFLAHAQDEKYMYIFLLGQSRMDAASILTIHETMWARKMSLSPEAVLTALRGLASSHLVEIDEKFWEVYVSGVFAADGIGKQPRRAKATLAAIRQIDSDRIRAIAMAELANELMKGAEQVPTGLRATVLERDGFRCKKCGWSPAQMVYAGADALADIRGLEVDHVYPKALGGSNELSNLQALCSDCNAKKGARV